MRRILYVQYTNPAGYPPLEHSSRILADAGWEVMFLGTGALGSNPLTFPAHRNITTRRMDFCHGGWRQKLHFLRYCLWTAWIGLTWRPEWAYASDPISCPATWLLQWIPGIRIVYHEHDSPEQQPGESPFLRLIAGFRRSVAKRADMCVLPNTERLDRFQRECGPVRAPLCVWNCPASAEAITEPRGPAQASLRLFYHGSIVPERLPSTVLGALALLPPFVKLRIAGYETAGSRGYSGKLRLQARALGIEDRVEFIATVPQRADLLRETLQSDIGLALMPMQTGDFNCKTMTGASNKAFDYLACGLALVVSNLPDWREMFVDEGYACGCDPGDSASIAATIRSLIEDPVRMRAMGEAGRRRILAAWNYENQFQPVLEHLESSRRPNETTAESRRFQNAG